VGRWTGSWLGGPVSAGLSGPLPAPGRRLGLPEQGLGSVAGIPARLGAFLVDALLSAGVALLFFGVPVRGQPPWSTIVFAGMYLFFTALFGQTPGMRLFGVSVVRLATGGVPGPGPALVRTALLCLLIPALLTDRDNRGLHDRASGTVVVRTRAEQAG